MSDPIIKENCVVQEVKEGFKGQYESTKYSVIFEGDEKTYDWWYKKKGKFNFVPPKGFRFIFIEFESEKKGKYTNNKIKDFKTTDKIPGPPEENNIKTAGKSGVQDEKASFFASYFKDVVVQYIESTGELPTDNTLRQINRIMAAAVTSGRWCLQYAQQPLPKKLPPLETSKNNQSKSDKEEKPESNNNNGKANGKNLGEKKNLILAALKIIVENHEGDTSIQKILMYLTKNKVKGMPMVKTDEIADDLIKKLEDIYTDSYGFDWKALVDRGETVKLNAETSDDAPSEELETPY